MVSDDEVSRSAFEEFADHAIRSIAMRNANMPVSEIVETVV
jgi:ATP-binding protein involved in chromosome partitioning